jgi:predicted nuclease of predicted toxin-antitoxin system
MKLLLDQNLSRKLISSLEEVYPGSAHISSVLSEKANDDSIWQYAKENDFTVVTKDDDFEQRSVLEGFPPKVIWIRLGNCRTADVSALLIRSVKIILAFADDREKSILPIP